MLGFLLYLDTLYFAPYVLAFLITFWAIVARRGQVKEMALRNLDFIKVFLLFLALCTFNTLAHGFKGIPNMYMQVFMLITAFALNRRDAKVFILLSCFECLVGVAEYVAGVSSFVQEDPSYFGEEAMLYFKRVNGLSGNSSTLSEKVLISLILLYNEKQEFVGKKKKRVRLVVRKSGMKNGIEHLIFLVRRRKRWLTITIRRNGFPSQVKPFLYGILLVGLFISFNRTAIITAAVFAAVILFQRFKHRSRALRMVIVVAVMVCVIPVVIALWDSVGQLIVMQFSRGDTSSMLTGRPYIWSLFGQFIRENLLLGNGSVHLLVPYYSGMIHSHNSFMQLLADHGLVLAVIYLVNIILRFNKNNWLCCLPFIVLSLTQYTLFWGYSIGDVFFFAFLCNPVFEKSSRDVLPRKHNVSRLKEPAYALEQGTGN